jgi:dihydrofolate reductase
MGRLKLQMQITVDGFDPSGNNDDLPWDEIKAYSLELLDSADTIILGRKTATEFIPYWDKVAGKPEESWYEVARRISDARKIVFSQSLDRSDWKNSIVEKGNLSESIRRLKAENDKDIIVYGGVSFVSSLIAAGLIDEFHLFVNPIAVGRGSSIFAALERAVKLELKKSVAYAGGVVLLHYEPRG